MRKILITVATALLGYAFGPAQAGDDALYRALGEKSGIAVLMNDFTLRLKADAAIGHFFKDVKPAGLADALTDNICQVAGGPCVYEGATMKKSHADLAIDRAAFNRMVEVLQDVMDAKGVPFTAQNQLLARLAPMYRDIITR